LVTAIERAPFLYLHGFASGPGSTKAQYFRTQLAAVGVELRIPDLAPDFTNLTISSQLALVEAQLSVSTPAVLLGSSLGAYVAALVAARHPTRVAGLVLMAPAVGFAARWEARVGAEVMARWRATGTTNVYHYGRRREEPLAIGLLDDAYTYPAEPDPTCPTLILAGRHDEAVPLDAVTHFAHARPGREMISFDAGHELTEVLPALWQHTRAFLAKLSPPRL
jgi:uncharacterized protein